MAIVDTLQNPNRLNNKVYPMPIPEGAPVSAFINSEVPFTGVNFTDLSLSIFDCEGNEIIENAVNLQDIVVSGGYRVYWENMKLTGLSVGKIYELFLVDTSTNEYFKNLGYIKYVSPNPKYTCVSYRNSSDIFNFSYEVLPSFRNVVYLDLAEIDNQNEYDFTNYSEVSTGNIRNQKSQTKNYSVLESILFDDNAHEGMKGLSMHDDILINGRQYTVKEGYQQETDVRSGISKGSIEVYDVERNEINLNI